MDEGLTLLRFFGYDDETFGATLAIIARGQGMGSTVHDIVKSLEDSAQRGSNQARDTLSFYHRADEALKSMAAHKHS